jgi:hypothetical protein
MSNDALKVQTQLESKYLAETRSIDEASLALYGKDENQAREYLTKYTQKTVQNTFDQWKLLSEYLLVKYMDGNIKKEKDGKFQRTSTGYPEFPFQPGYPDSWKKSVINDTGSKLLVPAGAGH